MTKNITPATLVAVVALLDALAAIDAAEVRAVAADTEATWNTYFAAGDAMDAASEDLATALGLDLSTPEGRQTLGVFVDLVAPRRADLSRVAATLAA